MVTRVLPADPARRGAASASLPQPFDGYPSLVTRIGRSPLRHMAVLPVDWPRERLLDLARRQAVANRMETCLCLGPAEAVLVDPDGRVTDSSSIPTGVPVVERLALAEPVPETDDVVARRNVDRPPPGLARCPTCGWFAGAYLALNGEGDGDRTPRVVPVHCQCENHNRCAGCGGPLADARLSAYRYDESIARIQYLAAYGAFSHRCPAPRGSGG